ncbi:MAG: ankyrin repeat domain-containing protein [Deltaproteobacteria bacterium]|nr:ankyrin repeat domain-containing protein [Deltaproteobacteria bacterium]
MREGMREVVNACLEAGGDPDLADHQNEAPLLWAAHSGDTAMVERLIAAGANVDRRTRSGVSAGERASMHGHDALAKRLT